MNRLSAMEAFVRVIETGSFSGAARQLRIGQPAVSKAVAQIEERLGVRLLLRTTHGLSPTESGQNFYEHAKRAIEEAEEADLAARGARAALFTVSSEWMFAPELKSGAVTTVLEDWSLPPIDLWAVFPTGRRASAKARAFATFVEQQLFDNASVRANTAA